MNRRRKRLDPNTVVLLKHIGIGVLVLTTVALLIAGVWHGTRLSALTITQVEVTGGETIKHETVEEKVSEQLEGTYLGLIPRRFAWLYPMSEIMATVDDMERINNVQVSRLGGTTLQVAFDEYEPFALWCESVESEQCQFVDRDGFAFGLAPQLSGGSFLRFITLGQPPARGDVITSGETLDTLLTLVTLLELEGWYISYVELDQVGDAYLSVVGGGELKVAVGQSPVETVENLAIILASDDFAHITPGNFGYIDLRFGKKVFVNEELAAPEVETASASTSSNSEQSQ